jgi:hypothetical protein
MGDIKEETPISGSPLIALHPLTETLSQAPPYHAHGNCHGNNDKRCQPQPGSDDGQPANVSYFATYRHHPIVIVLDGCEETRHQNKSISVSLPCFTERKLIN